MRRKASTQGIAIKPIPRNNSEKKVAIVWLMVQSVVWSIDPLNIIETRKKGNEKRKCEGRALSGSVEFDWQGCYPNPKSEGRRPKETRGPKSEEDCRQDMIVNPSEFADCFFDLKRSLV
jgi:hypothetical protein